MTWQFILSPSHVVSSSISTQMETVWRTTKLIQYSYSSIFLTCRNLQGDSSNIQQQIIRAMQLQRDSVINEKYRLLLFKTVVVAAVLLSPFSRYYRRIFPITAVFTIVIAVLPNSPLPSPTLRLLAVCKVLQYNKIATARCYKQHE